MIGILCASTSVAAYSGGMAHRHANAMRCLSPLAMADFPVKGELNDALMQRAVETQIGAYGIMRDQARMTWLQRTWETFREEQERATNG